MSEYEGKDPKMLLKSISKTAARGYLTDLILFNAKLRSELSSIQECDPSLEEESVALV